MVTGVTGESRQQTYKLTELKNGTNEFNAPGAETNQRGVDGSNETNADVDD